MGLVIWVTDISKLPCGQPNLLPHWSNPYQPSRFISERCRSLWSTSQGKYLVAECFSPWWDLLGREVSVVYAGSVSPAPPPPPPLSCQYFLKWPPVCSRTQHRGPVTPLFGFKTWKHKEQKATNWTKYFRSREVFRLEIPLSLHLLDRFVQV